MCLLRFPARDAKRVLFSARRVDDRMEHLAVLVEPEVTLVRIGGTNGARRWPVEDTQPLQDTIAVLPKPLGVTVTGGEGEAHLGDHTVENGERDVGDELGEAPPVDEQVAHGEVGLTVTFDDPDRVEADPVGDRCDRVRLRSCRCAEQRANREEKNHAPVHGGILPRHATPDSNWLHFPLDSSDNVSVEMANKRLCSAIILLVVIGSVTAPAEEQVHVLARGETIYTLARTYDLAADVILEYNDIADPTRLAVGTRILIPGSYVVQEGEYVYSIARKLDVHWLDLLEANGLGRDDVVRPGDVLFVPRSSPERTVETTPDPGAKDEPSGSDSEGSDSEPSDERGSEARVASGYAGNWPHPGERGGWDGKFPGVVMSGSEGDEFRSVTDGVVEFVGPFSSFGKLILVRSANGYLYGYAGADRLLVAEGARVEAGTVLGTVGFSPAFDSAKVLFTVWKNNRYVDPETAPRG